MRSARRVRRAGCQDSEVIFGNQVQAPQDVDAGAWIRSGLGEFGTVGGLVPDTFAECVLVWNNESRQQGWSPSQALVATLARLLNMYTATPTSAWFAVWEGYGFPHLSELEQLALFELPHRRHYLLTGPLTAAAGLRDPSVNGRIQPPDLWWPSDRRWIVAGDTDLSWTYVGGDAEVCEAVLQEFGERAKPVERAAWNGSAAD